MSYIYAYTLHIVYVKFYATGTGIKLQRSAKHEKQASGNDDNDVYLRED